MVSQILISELNFLAATTEGKPGGPNSLHCVSAHVKLERQTSEPDSPWGPLPCTLSHLLALTVLEGPERIHVLILLLIMQEKKWNIPNLGNILFSGFKEDFQMDVFKVLAAILHLGNVQIAAVGNERSVISVRYVFVSPILCWEDDQQKLSGLPCFCISAPGTLDLLGRLV